MCRGRAAGLLGLLPGLAGAVTLPATARPAALPSTALSSLAEKGFAVIPDWLPEPMMCAVLADALALEREGLARSAAVGSRTGGDEQRRLDEQIRKSSLCSLYPPPRPSAGDVDTRMALYESLRSLCKQLNECAA